MVDAATRTPPSHVLDLLDVMSDVLGATGVRLFVADYSLRRLQRIDARGAIGPPIDVAGTLLGRVFTSGEIQTVGQDPIVVSIPLVEGSCSLGVLEIDVDVWDRRRQDDVGPLVAVFVMAWIVKGRYTDRAARARRSQQLSLAAEVQWDLLPPLACATEIVSLSGILEPAYTIGGDSFDYALSDAGVEFAIVDAVGHGMSAVTMAAAAVNSLRNSRRERTSLSAAYTRADQAIESQFGDCYYVTGVIGSLDARRGVLTWINAGHVRPLLVRNGTFVGQLQCAPSLPMGLGGAVVEVAEQPLQRGDRVLFYTDGITEARAPDGSIFGEDRLADLLVRASREDLPVQSTVRHLADSIVGFSALGLGDDATMLLIEYRPTPG